MKRRGPTRPARETSTSFAGVQFPSEVILLAVRWNLRYGLSCPDLEDLLAERGIEVDCVKLGKRATIGQRLRVGAAVRPSPMASVA